MGRSSLTDAVPLVGLPPSFSRSVQARLTSDKCWRTRTLGNVQIGGRYSADHHRTGRWILRPRTGRSRILGDAAHPSRQWPDRYGNITCALFFNASFRVQVSVWLFSQYIPAWGVSPNRLNGC
jgi:hypothetical protein